MKKLILSILILSSCTVEKHTVLTIDKDNSNGTACGKPQYIATTAVHTGTLSESNLSLFNMITEARKNYGIEVTIQNVRYDLINGHKVSAIYDVVRCDTLK